MGADRLGPAAVEVGRNQAQSIQYAKRTKAENYGIFLMYNLRSINSADYLSGITQELYGKKTVYTETIPN